MAVIVLPHASLRLYAIVRHLRPARVVVIDRPCGFTPAIWQDRALVEQDVEGGVGRLAAVGL